MRKIALQITLCLALLFLANTHSYAQDGKRDWLSYRIMGVDYYSPFVEDLAQFTDDYTAGGEVAYTRNLNKALNLWVPFRAVGGKVPRMINGKPSGVAADFQSEQVILSLDANLQLQAYKEGRVLVPFLMAGIGFDFESETKDFYGHIPVGAGINFHLTPVWTLQLTTERRFSLEEDRDHYHHGIGVMINLNKDRKETPKVLPPMDSDGDGVMDKDDDCPDEKGVAAFNGCPDSDNDGIADKNDDCPNQAGTKAFGGCPDSDGDGIADKDDECPNQAGTRINNGCPVTDADGDGVVDAEDKCPDLAGSKATGGCPDKDADGVADGDDRCPDKAGSPAFRGCPDSDADGIVDIDDRCPNSAGPVSNNGCPEMKEEEKEVLNFAMKAVQFETARATLKASSFAVLDQIVDILKKYPDYKVYIDGHTDSIGSAETNQTLSERRAKSCADYIVSKGISRNRVVHKGYGETRPIANNKYKDGREQNRRVEFRVDL